eukprot:TRINITY_DN976_c0_g1_i10.p1 TRINITY_DN976_c0_g1~~TRINITY_DN976_c0_g1_i10.p1  ORF type:complete len:729 (-),score=102.40 TRINITY_DN976_c0_g1_i10:109-2295(-)
MNGKENHPYNEHVNFVDIQSYQATCNECIQRLQAVWQDMEVPVEKISDRLRQLSVSAGRVWETAVSEAEEERNELRKGVEAAVKEIRKIQDQLGEAHVDENLRESTGSLIQAVAAESKRSMKSLYDEVMGCVNQWKRRKEERVCEFQIVHEQIIQLMGQMGQQTPGPLFGNLSPNKFDISQANLEFLALEKEKLKAEKNVRERKLEAMLSRLRKVCIELGEDDLQIAQSIHPSLQNYRDTLPGQKFAFNQTPQQFNQTPQTRSQGEARFDLGDQVFKSLQSKLDEMLEIKITKEERANQMLDMLNGLWSALEIPETDVDRTIFVKLLTGAAKLHDKTIEKCLGEVARLETQKKQIMVGMIQNKERELQQMCEQSHLIMPDMSILLYGGQNMNMQGHGQITSVLSKIMKFVRETQQIVEKRQPIIRGIEEINQVKAEVDWLQDYERDDNRFKGRDSCKRLQRSIKASKQRERLPGLTRKLIQMIEEWEANQNVHFQYDNYLDYKTEVLEPIQAEIFQQEQERQKGREKQKQAQKFQNNQFPKTTNSKPSGFLDGMRPQTAQARLNPQPNPQSNLLPSQRAEPSIVASTTTPRTPRGCQLTPFVLLPPSTNQTEQQTQAVGMKAPCNILQDKLNQLIAASPLPQRQNSQEVNSAPMECSQISGQSSKSENSGALASFKAKMMGSTSIGSHISIPPLPLNPQENVDESRGIKYNSQYNYGQQVTEDENMEP